MRLLIPFPLIIEVAKEYGIVKWESGRDFPEKASKQMPEHIFKCLNYLNEKLGYYSKPDSILAINSEKIHKELRDKLLAITYTEAAKGVTGARKLQKQIDVFNKIESDPIEGTKVSTLEALEEILIRYIIASDNHWLFKEQSDGFVCPLVVTSVRYHEAVTQRDYYTPAHVTMEMHFSRLGKEKSDKVVFHYSDITGAPTIKQILLKEGYFLENPSAIEDYAEEMKRFNEVYDKVGKQLSGVGLGYNNSGLRYSYGEMTSLEFEGNFAKLVIDEWEKSHKLFNEESELKARINKENLKKESKPAVTKVKKVLNKKNADKDEIENIVIIPEHPYLYTFDLRTHNFVSVHINNVIEYKYDETLYDKLVLPESHKNLITILVQGTDDMIHDIVSGKASGIIVMATGEPGTGKAQPLDSLLYTPTGPIKMRDIREGHLVLTPKGIYTKVLKTFPQEGLRPVHEITFADGRKVQADEEHLWKVKAGGHTSSRGKLSNWSIINTKELIQILKKGKNPLYVPLTKPIEHFFQSNLPLDPWLLGYLIGDGCFTQKIIYVSTADKELVNKINTLLPQPLSLIHVSRCDYRISAGNRGGITNAVTQIIKELGLHGKSAVNKEIPEIYMNGSYLQRLEIIRGLLDSDGTASASGSIEFTSASEKLAIQLQRLLWGIGAVCKLERKKAFFTYKGKRKQGLDKFKLSIRYSTPSDLFSLQRKRKRCITYQYSESLALRIMDIRLVGLKETKCILVEDNEHLYLTDNFVTTHNTLTAEVYAEAVKKPLYIVQASQLGVNIDKLEEVLKQVLERAQRWKAILLIDEADVYVRNRGDDLVQNAVVGVFLRVLEYFRGVLFMTSNRETMIDDAILSRATAHIRYTRPDTNDLKRIWIILAKQFNVEIAETVIDNVVQRLPNISGRDVRSIIKLSRLLSIRQRSKIDLQMLLYVSEFQDLPNQEKG